MKSDIANLRLQLAAKCLRRGTNTSGTFLSRSAKQREMTKFWVVLNLNANHDSEFSTSILVSRELVSLRVQE